MRLRALGDDASGISMVEVLVSLLIFSVVVIGLSAAGVIAADSIRASRSDTQMAAAVHYQFDVLKAQGYDNLAAGSDTVHGIPMSWEIQGGAPKRIILTVKTIDRKGVLVPDTFVTYLADWSK